MNEKEIKRTRLLARLAHVQSRTHKDNANIQKRIKRELRNLDR